jgi:hypothetical protein
LNDTGELERTILVLRAAGLSPRSFAGRDLVRELERRRRPDGSYAGGVVLTSFSVLALKASGRGRSAGVRASAAWLRRQQNPDGGWSLFGRGGESGIDETATVIEGLVAGGGKGSRAVTRGMSFLARAQNPDGGFPLTLDGASNAQSTSYVVQAAVAAGRDPGRLRRGGSRSAVSYLRSLLTAGGTVRYSRTSAQTPVWVTAQALAALQRRPLPLAPVARRRAARAGSTSATRRSPAPRAPAGAASGSRLVPLGVLLAAHRLGIAAGIVIPVY